MPLVFDAALTTYLTSELLEIAYLWVLVRRDGTTFYFTSHESDLVYGGHTYSSRPGLDPFSLEVSSTLDSNSTEITGFMLEDEGITEFDLSRRKFDGALLTLYLAVYADTSIPPGLLYTGRLGDISFGSASFRAELRSLISLTQHKISTACSKLCNVKRLGDSRCRPGDPTWISSYRMTGTVTTVLSSTRFRSTDMIGQPNGRFNTGYFRWTLGDNLGIETEIRSNLSSNGEIRLAEPMIRVLSVGDTFTCDWGCNRQISICAGTFSNGTNHRGQAFTPGLDRILVIQ